QPAAFLATAPHREREPALETETHLRRPPRLQQGRGERPEESRTPHRVKANSISRKNRLVLSCCTRAENTTSHIWRVSFDKLTPTPPIPGVPTAKLATPVSHRCSSSRAKLPPV